MIDKEIMQAITIFIFWVFFWIIGWRLGSLQERIEKLEKNSDR